MNLVLWITIGIITLLLFGRFFIKTASRKISFKPNKKLLLIISILLLIGSVVFFIDHISNEKVFQEFITPDIKEFGVEFGTMFYTVKGDFKLKGRVKSIKQRVHEAKDSIGVIVPTKSILKVPNSYTRLIGEYFVLLNRAGNVKYMEANSLGAKGSVVYHDSGYLRILSKDESQDTSFRQYIFQKGSEKLKEHIRSQNNDTISITKYIYDDNKNELEYNVYNKSDGHDFILVNKRMSEYDYNNRRVTQKVYKDGELANTCFLDYDRKGRMKKKLCIIEDKILEDSLLISYDSKGRVSEVVEYGKYGNKTHFEYDNKDRLIHKREFDLKGSLERTYKVAYNEMGNVIDYKYLDKSDMIPRDHITYEYEYDELDNWISCDIFSNGEDFKVTRDIIYYD